MLDEAIELMNKQIELYKVQDEYTLKGYSKYSIQRKIKEELKKEIEVREYILKILQQKKEGILWKD